MASTFLCGRFSLALRHCILTVSDRGTSGPTQVAFKFSRLGTDCATVADLVASLSAAAGTVAGTGRCRWCGGRAAWRTR